MKIRSFQDTNTLHIEFKSDTVAETCDLDENTILDVDEAGRILSITLEQAGQRADIPRFSLEKIPA